MKYGSGADGTGGAAGIQLAGGLGFIWSWINLLNLVMIALLLLPNILYALKRGGESNLCANRVMNGLEQAGRYGSMLFMAVCIGEEGFSFPSVSAFVCYCVGSLVLLSAYWICWIVYFRMAGVHIFVKSHGPAAVFMAGKRKVRDAKVIKWALVFFPCGLFLLCGITLRYLPLIVCGVIFLVGHTYVTYENIRKSEAKG